MTTRKMWIILSVLAFTSAFLWNAGFVVIVQPFGGGRLVVGTILWILNTIGSFTGGLLAAGITAIFMGINPSDYRAD